MILYGTVHPPITSQQWSWEVSEGQVQIKHQQQ
jgi:hypothetical protein